MAQKFIDFGSFPDDPDADAIRTAFQKTQQNFNELFSGLSAQAVSSVNKTQGAGITVNSPTGNVVVSANIANITLNTNTLRYGLGASDELPTVTYTDYNQVLYVDLPNNLITVKNISLLSNGYYNTGGNGNLYAENIIANANLVANGSVSFSNISGGNLSISGTANVTGNINAGNANIAGNITVSGNGNVIGNLTVTTDLISSNIFANSGLIKASLIEGTLTSNSNSQPNITSVGTLSTLDVTGNITAGNIYANSGELSANLITGTLTTNAQPNITSLGTLTSLDVNGNIIGVNVTANTGVFTGNANGLTNIPGSNVTGAVANASYATNAGDATTAGTVTSNSQSNITSVGTLTSLDVSGNLSAGNVSATLLAGTLTTNAQPNITSVGILTGLDIGGNILPNANITYDIGNNTNRFKDIYLANSTIYLGSATISANGNSLTLTNPDGGQYILEGNSVTLSNTIVSGNSNVSVENNSNVTVGVSGNANILTVTGTGANVLGTFNATGNLVAANANLGNAVTANYFIGSGEYLSNIPAGNISGNTANSNYAAYAGNVVNSSQPNITSVGTLSSLTISGNVNAGNVMGGNLVSANFVAGTLTNASQPNITSVGTLSSLDSSGNITAANIVANTGTFTGNASGLTNIPGANVTGTVANATFATSAGSATTAGTVTANAQSNITSVGTLSSLTVTGNISSGNANLGNLAIANFFQGDGGLLTNISVAAGSYITNGNSNVYVDVDSNVRISVSGNANVLVVTGTGANIAGTLNATGNANVGNLGATKVVANLDGTVLTASQTNITSLGTLTGLNVNGISNLGPNGNVIITGGVANAFLMTNGSGNLTWDTATLVPAQGANTQVIFNDGGTTYAGSANLTFDKNTNTLSVGNGLSVTGNATFGNIYANSGTVKGSLLTGTLTTANQANVTELGTLGYLVVSGNINAGNTLGGNLVSGNYLAGTLTTAAQSNITSVGTLTSLDVTGNVIAGNMYANSGTVGASLLAGTLTTTSQPNITSIGTLSSITVTNNGVFGNVYANSGTIGASTLKGEGGNISNIQGANVSGTVATATTAGTVTTASQPNITSVGTLTSLTVSGNVDANNLNATNKVVASTLTSNVTTGTAPFTVFSTTKVANLNADTVDGYDTDTTATANTIAVRNADGNLTANFFIGNGSQLTGLSTSSISNGNSNVSVPSANGNVNISAVGNANVLVVTGTGANITGILGVSGNANVNNLGTTRILASGNITTTQLISNIATGTAPIVVSSTTKVANLNADTLDGYDTDTAATANTVVVRNADGNITANNISGTLATAAQTNITSVGSLGGTQISSLGVGTAASGTTGEIRATDNITAYYSDERLKKKLGNIENALEKVSSLSGFYYEANELAQSLGYKVKREVGLSAQEVEKVLPEVVVPAPIDDKYKTLHYERLIPLLIEAIKEIKQDLNNIKSILKNN